MKKITFTLLLLLLVLTPLAGCWTARRLYLWSRYMLARVVSENMAPTIKAGEGVAIDPGRYAKNPVRRFDIVAYKLPRENIPPDVGGFEPDTIHLSRVVALGGETVEVRGGRVYVNGAPSEGPFEYVPHDPDEQFGPVDLPEGEYFLLGDNRVNSLDSRYWAKPGLKRSSIVGQVVEIIRE